MLVMCKSTLYPRERSVRNNRASEKWSAVTVTPYIKDDQNNEPSLTPLVVPDCVCTCTLESAFCKRAAIVSYCLVDRGQLEIRKHWQVVVRTASCVGDFIFSEGRLTFDSSDYFSIFLLMVCTGLWQELYQNTMLACQKRLDTAWCYNSCFSSGFLSGPLRKLICL